MPNAAAKRENKPSITRWLADDDEVDFDADVFEEFDEVGTGVPVTAAPHHPLPGRVRGEEERHGGAISRSETRRAAVYGPVAIRT
jgi:hypothetical protein